ncbi:phosphatase PAP2 family protein [Peptostreptococcaceae bacterium OttesenSCG-928-C18]|nr:phosphatase PAP2 family protein [Peptostreptococcaceae bacterium OttesenSCG-928-C18]
MKIGRNKKIFFIATLILVLIVGTYLTLNNGYTSFDFNVLSIIRKTIYPNKIFILFTKLGNPSSYIYILIAISIYLIYKKKYRLLVALIFSVLFSAGLMKILKFIFQRERPFEFFTYSEGGYSFPSGHSISSAAFYLTIAQIYYNKYKNKVITLFISLIPFIIGLSRLVLGVHWPTDVIFGLLLGFSISLISADIYIKNKELKNE